MQRTFPPHDAATRVNPEAGAHPISGDPVATAAAERAIRRSWAAFPYYLHRYGERGRRFSASDSGWLLVVSLGDEDEVRREVRWLANVLASRGMPRWLLEHHLDALADEVAAACPEPAARVVNLRAAAADLRRAREQHVSAEAHARAEATFAARVPDAQRRELARVGGLLAAAVADERDGVRGALDSLAGWLLAPGRHPEAVHEAVRATLSELGAPPRP